MAPNGPCIAHKCVPLTSRQCETNASVQCSTLKGVVGACWSTIRVATCTDLTAGNTGRLCYVFSTENIARFFFSTFVACTPLM